MPRPRILIAVTVHSGYFRDILRGIYRYSALRGGWDLERREPAQVDRDVNPAHYQGAIACAGASGSGVERFIAAGLPVVDVSNWEPSRQVPAITSDDDAIGVLAADHLLGLGHRNFAYAGLKKGIYSQRRGDGFCRRLAQEGHKVERHLLYEGRHAGGQWVNQIECTRQWLVALPKPCGLFVCADQDALHVSQIAQSAGLAMPDELAMIGVDDDDLVCVLANPPLTSVRTDGVGVGMAAAQSLDRMLTTGETQPARRLPPLGVTIRPSTEGRPMPDPVVRAAVAWLRLRAVGDAPLEECARVAGVSLRTLQARCARFLGHGPAEELLRLRLEHAARLLAETDLPLKAVAHRSGFASASYLCTAFARERGMTPGGWRKKHQTGQITAMSA